MEIKWFEILNIEMSLLLKIEFVFRLGKRMPEVVFIDLIPKYWRLNYRNKLFCQLMAC